MPTALYFGDKAIQTAANGAFVVGSQTLTAGQKTTVSGTAISVGSFDIVIDGSTHALQPSESTPTALSVGDKSVKTGADGAFVVGSQTLTAGQKTTISGTAISIGSSDIVVDGTTHSFSPNTLPASVVVSGTTLPLVAFASTTAQQTYSLDGQRITVAPSAFTAASTTMINGTPVLIKTAKITVVSGSRHVPITETVSEAVALGNGTANNGTAGLIAGSASPTGIGGSVNSGLGKSGGVRIAPDVMWMIVTYGIAGMAMGMLCYGRRGM